MSEMEDDLKELFDQLDDEDQEAIEQPVHKPIEFKELEPALKPEVIKVQLDNVPPPPDEIIQPAVDINKKMQQLEVVTDNILSACEADRMQAQEAIDLIRGEIERTLQQQGRPPTAFVEGLIKAIEVKAGINLTAVKIMEANAKMLAATKAGTSVNVNTNNSVSNVSLTDILSQPVSPTDEY